MHGSHLSLDLARLRQVSLVPGERHDQRGITLALQLADLRARACVSASRRQAGPAPTRATRTQLFARAKESLFVMS